MRKSLAVLVLALSLALASAAGVLAHARYDHSTPSPGQVLTTAPAQIDIFTVQDMRKVAGQNVITVTGPDGTEVNNGNTVVDDANRKHFSIGLKPNLGPGRYQVDFKTWSDLDGEHDHGSFAFYIGNGPTAAQKAQDAKLTLTTDTGTSSSSSHTGLIIAIVAGVVVVPALVGGGIGMAARRRRRA